MMYIYTADSVQVLPNNCNCVLIIATIFDTKRLSKDNFKSNMDKIKVAWGQNINFK